MAAKVIYRGPINEQPRTLNLPVAGALLPGSMVEQSSTDTLAQLTTAVGKRPLVLSNLEFKGQDIATAYTSGDTGVAYEPRPNEQYQVRVAAATYATGAALTIAASGRLAAATAGTVVVAFFTGTPGAYAAGDLADVTIANAFTVPV